MAPGRPPPPAGRLPSYISGDGRTGIRARSLLGGVVRYWGWSHVGKAALVGEEDWFRGVTWGHFRLASRAQAQAAAAAGILVTLPVGVANRCTAERGGPRGAEGPPRAAATAAAGAWRPGAAWAAVANMAQNRDGGNPFAEPGELDNPFQVTCAGRLWAAGLTLLGSGGWG